MHKWGLVVTCLYAFILLAFLVPAAVYISASGFDIPKVLGGVRDLYGTPLAWVPIVILLVSQATLLFLSVDTSQKRLKPRAHVLVSTSIAALLTALLLSAVIWSLGLALRGEDFWDKLFNTQRSVLLFWAALWLFWGVIFYLYLRNSSNALDRIISGLLAGSVLELLIVVPCHIVVRRRHDCSAPMVTSFGIATGVAIMLLSFGPSVLFLFKKRFDSYSRHPSA